MRILLAIAVDDYGRPGAGPSFELTSWHDPLIELGHDVHVFDVFDRGWAGDPTATGAALLARAQDLEPDLILMMLMRDEVPVATIDRLASRFQIANWFADDAWRYRSYSRHLAPHFSWVVTTCDAAKRSYDASGVHAILSPWGFNPAVFHPVDTPLVAEVGFVGQRYGRRAAVVERLRRQGRTVLSRGAGWPQGRADTNELAQIFASTRVNLSFLESSAGPFLRRGIQRRGTTRLDALANRFWAPPMQLKARPFEITACGGFVLTNEIPELRRYFDVGTEIATFTSDEDLVRRLDHFLADEGERAAVAQAGLRRSREYTWTKVLARVLRG